MNELLNENLQKSDFNTEMQENFKKIDLSIINRNSVGELRQLFNYFQEKKDEKMPVEIKKEIPKKETEKKEVSKDGLTDEDISKLVWGK